jgi:hypothetical protein
MDKDSYLELTYFLTAFILPQLVLSIAAFFLASYARRV